ncbi:MAG TPA: type II CAAX endopeptidase family protein [Candidatus Limnocylindrales bacterium]|nr:type II CAAX endopeptidase family protein [Candidatus Limnocylindrales bacterium]
MSSSTPDEPRPPQTTTEAPPPPPPANRPGASIFTIEGRAAPGLFVLGWLASIVGLVIVLVAFQAGPGGSAGILLTIGLAVLGIGLVAGAGAQALERRARGRDAYTGPSPVLLLAASIPVASLAVVLVGIVLDLLHVELAQPLRDFVLLVLQDGVYVGLVALLVVGSGALSWRDVGFTRRAGRAVEDIGWGAVFAAPVIAVTLVVTGVLVAIFRVVPESPLPPTGQAGGFILHLLSAAVVAPIGEEILFRGVATTAWVRSFGVRSGIVRGALFFAVAHVLLISASTVGEGAALAAVGFGGRIPIALVLGWVFVRRRSIYASMGLHATFNAILLTIAELSVAASPSP